MLSENLTKEHRAINTLNLVLKTSTKVLKKRVGYGEFNKTTNKILKNKLKVKNKKL